MGDINIINSTFLQVVSALGWTIVHSIWQCGVIALVLHGFLKFNKSLAANWRSVLCVVCLLISASLSIVTFLNNYLQSNVAATEIYSQALITNLTSNNATTELKPSLELALPYIVLLWAFGCIFLVLKNLLKLYFSQKLKTKDTRNTPEAWENKFVQLCQNLKIKKTIALRLSEHVNVPCVIGHFKPVILLPVSVITGTPIEQIELILLHELGHIHRNDYMIGLIQIFLKTVYFFNPGLLIISNTLDTERENACDDIVMSTCNNPLNYAKALQEFATMKLNKNFSVSIQGKNNQLLLRIKRLFKNRTNTTNPIEVLCTAIGVLLLGATLVGCSSLNAKSNENILQIDAKDLSGIYLPIKNELPKYSAKSMFNNIKENECTTVFDVSPSGNTENISEPECLVKGYYEDAVRHAIEKTKYAPKIINGSPVTVVGVLKKFIFSHKKHPKDLPEGEIIETGTIKRIPSPITHTVKFEYPKNSKGEKIPGYCDMEYTITKNGNVEDVEVIKCVPEGYFEKASIEISEQAKYEPIMANGIATRVEGFSSPIIWRVIEEEK